MFPRLMKSVSIAFILCLVLISTSDATKLAGEFLATGFGARALGMGGAFVSIADDASAVYWNPAGLIQLEQSQILFMHSERFGNLVDYDCISLARPLSREPGEEASGAISIIWLRVSDILLTSHLNKAGKDFIDSNGNGDWDPGERRLLRPDMVKRESDNEMAGYLSYSKRFSPRLSAGLNAKVIWKKIADISSLGMGLDVGALYELATNWKVGLNVQDFTGTPLYWDGWYYTDGVGDSLAKHDVSTKETIYPTVKVGTSYTLPLASISGKLVFSGDCDFKFEGLAIEETDFWAGDISADVRLGLLYEYNRILRLSLGMDRRKLSAGAGLNISQFSLDYAFWRDTEIDNTHRVSVSMNF
jgi:hypothetical protein